MNKNNNKKGSVLILSIVISSVFLALGLSITSIVYKELLRLDVYSKSQDASSIADTAWECALYQDYKEFLFSGLSANFDLLRSARRVNCGEGLLGSGEKLFGWDVKVDGVPKGNNTIKGISTKVSAPNQTYEYFIGSEIGGPCAQVKVEKFCKKRALEDLEVCRVGTTIRATGYDSCARNDNGLLEVGRIQRRLYLGR